MDPETGSEIRTESVFHAEYGYLHGRTASVVKNWNPLFGRPDPGQAYGFFTDFLTFSGPRKVGYAEIWWDWRATGIGQIPEFTITTDASFGWEIWAVVVVGTTDLPDHFETEEGEAWARITSIRLFDPDGNRITSGVYYSSGSGTAYNIEGASQLPEPGTGSLLLIALAIAGWKHRRPLPPLTAARWTRESSG
jgi:hypothetical protein